MHTALTQELHSTRYTAVMEPAERFNRFRFVLYQDDRSGAGIGRGTYFTGSDHIQPWIELQPDITFSPDDDDHRELFDAFTAVLDPGSHIMVHYLQDTETADAITADVPPPVTPLGFLLWQAGVRWYKDWYFTEGWMEGDQKLQGNLPPDDTTKQDREQQWQEELQEFIDRDSTYPICRDRAETLISQMDNRTHTN